VIDPSKVLIPELGLALNKLNFRWRLNLQVLTRSQFANIPGHQKLEKFSAKPAEPTRF
jgi:hypothetical protein